jgi:hypothetical protein
MSAAGSAAAQAREEGADSEAALKYGAAVGLSEYLSESLAGGIPGWGEGKLSGVIQKVTESPMVKNVLEYLGEGGESALATYLKNVTFTELTGLSKPLYNGWFTVSLAPSSSGKSVASMCIKAITQKLDEEDRRVREMMEDWLAEERTRKSSDGVRKPLNNSRLCGSDTTSSGLFQRFKELDPGTALYISTPELMSLKNVASGDYVKFFLMAHDAEEYSVERSTSTGESGRATLSLNVSAMAPIGIGQEFFAGHTEDGLVSRFIFSTIEENKNWDDLEPLYECEMDDTAFQCSVRALLERTLSGCSQAELATWDTSLLYLTYKRLEAMAITCNRHDSEVEIAMENINEAIRKAQ